MSENVFRYEFDAAIAPLEIEATLVLAAIATEAIHGEVATRLGVSHCFDAETRVCIIDATEAVVTIHQSHGYDHLAGGKDEAYYGAEAALNLELAGGKSHRYTLHDASHRMGADLSIHCNLGSILRVRETARKVGWKLGLR